MKWALVTTVLGYLILWQLDHIKNYILPIGVILLLIFSFSLVRQKLEVLPTLREKTKVIFVLLFFCILIVFGLYYLVNSTILPSYYLPPLLGLVVLSRGIIRWLVNLTTKEPKSFGIMSETLKGETVRSKAEKKVADWLYTNNIDYTYERTINLPDGSSILSDFYLTDSDIYIEYWGLSSADNEVGEKYRARKYEKIDQYAEHGYKLMSIYPHHLYELDHYIPEQIAILTGKSRGIWNWFKSLFSRSSKTSSKSSSQEIPNEPQSSMFCTNCGNEVTKLGEFCVKCGIEVT